MATKRGAPVLIEVLRGKSAPGQDAAARYAGVAGVPVKAVAAAAVGSASGFAAPSSAAAGADSGAAASGGGARKERAGLGGRAAGAPLRVGVREMALLASVVVVVIVGVWFVAFRSGQHAEKAQWEGRVPTVPESGAGNTNENNGGAAGVDPVGGAAVGGANSPAGRGGQMQLPEKVEAPAATGPLTLNDGMNHLVVGTFRRFADADESAKFLAGQNIGVIVTGPRGGDPTTKTSEWWVWAAQGFEKPVSTPAAGALRERVMQLGRLWRVQNKLAPTDFGQPYWFKVKKG
ncbi:hypothetical protein BH11PLA1_BH11PLA1_22940 [soil metagenome]